MRVISVNLAREARPTSVGRVGRTGISKLPVPGSVRFSWTGPVDDVVCDTTHHGGFDRAVYVFAVEEARWWEEALGRPVLPGRSGENITSEGIDLRHCVIGERLRIGSVLLEVSAPRIPCRVFADFWDVPDLVGRFSRRGNPGCYLRVVNEGWVTSGDKIAVTYRPSHAVTVGLAFRALTTESELLPELAAVTQFPPDIAKRIKKRLTFRGAPETLRG